MKIPAQGWLESISHKPHIIAGTCTAALLASASAADNAEKQQQQKPNISDSRISNAVESSLMQESSVPAHRIDISVVDGVATLGGTVKNILAKERAVRSVQTVRGITSIKDNIEVDAPERGDGELTSDVKSALRHDAATDTSQVDVSAEDGKVTLSGDVISWSVADLATRVAKGVNGVKSVEENFTLRHSTESSDEEILSRVNRAMEIDILLRPFFVDAQVDDGTVILDGTVGSIARRARHFRREG